MRVDRFFIAERACISWIEEHFPCGEWNFDVENETHGLGNTVRAGDILGVDSISCGQSRKDLSATYSSATSNVT